MHRITTARTINLPRYAFALMALSATPTLAQWSQWGGPDRNFSASADGISTSWPDSGPKTLWSRALGEGYSAIVIDDGRLFTGYRDGDDEIFVALDAKDGSTIWEYSKPAPLPKQFQANWGRGPNATPLVVGDRVITVGVNARLSCLNKSDGKPIWSHDLWNDFGGTVLEYGYASSPYLYKNYVILPVGGEGHSLMAFRVKDGSTVWAAGDFKNSYCSPQLIEVDGQKQIVLAMGANVVGYDPDNGRPLWSHPHKNQWDCNIADPIWNADDNILYVSSFGTGGSKAVKLSQKAGKTSVEEIWTTQKMKLGHTQAQRIGDYVYGTHWSMGGPGVIMALNIKDGEIAWKDRAIAKAHALLLGDKLLLLAENGTLMLARPSPEKFEVLAQASVLEERAWTVPTLIGSKLYLRDRKTIKALDLK